MSDPAPQFDARADRTVQLKAAALLIGVLVVVGAIMGVVWELWSPPGPAGLVLEHGIQADESETFVAGDGRFVILTLIVGLIAGGVAWFIKAARGVYVALALVVGGVLGAAVTELVGWALRGQGSKYRCGDGTFTCINHLPLTVHMHALLLTEAIAAVLVYLLCVAFAAADDLGRPDIRVRTLRRAARATDAAPGPVGSPIAPESGSVGPQRDLQDGWGHGDASGPA